MGLFFLDRRKRFFQNGCGSACGRGHSCLNNQSLHCRMKWSCRTDCWLLEKPAKGRCSLPPGWTCSVSLSRGWISSLRSVCTVVLSAFNQLPIGAALVSLLHFLPLFGTFCRLCNLASGSPDSGLSGAVRGPFSSSGAACHWSVLIFPELTVARYVSSPSLIVLCTKCKKEFLRQ